MTQHTQLNPITMKITALFSPSSLLLSTAILCCCGCSEGDVYVGEMSEQVDIVAVNECRSALTLLHVLGPDTTRVTLPPNGRAELSLTKQYAWKDGHDGAPSSKLIAVLGNDTIPLTRILPGEDWQLIGVNGFNGTDMRDPYDERLYVLNETRLRHIAEIAASNKY